jgi:two-component system chemotaxis response regulator CheB
MTRVLVVDDSRAMRDLISRILASDPDLEIAGCAADGEEAVQMTQAKKPDIIVMDLDMPKVDGVEATRRIMQAWPTPIVVMSGSENRGETGNDFGAIDAGALAIVQRPSGTGDAADNTASAALVRMVKSMAEVRVVRRWSKDAHRSTGRATSRTTTTPTSASGPPPRLVVIGASTGGPAVLREILAEVSSAYPAPIVIVQHMTAGFVIGFAQWLSTAADFPVLVAEDGHSLVGGTAYLAPDGFQMGIRRDLRITLSRAPPEHGMAPSVSYLFRSIHDECCPGTVAVLLTGMGKDGASELKQLRDKGALTIVQDRASAAVYGMPGEAIKQGAAELVLSPAEIGKMLMAQMADGAT